MSARRTLRSLWLAATLVVATLGVLHGQNAPANAHRIAVFGSSVANGTGDELQKEGYTGRLRALLAPGGWEVLNQSRGGDNTVRMAPRFEPDGEPAPNTRYLLPVNPHYVLLGLSLGNEGIANVKTKEEKDGIFTQFERGMHGFIDRSREHHIVPVVTNCYTRMDFTDVEYEYTRRMNLLINGWDVPSVNFLGAVDDGTGKWAKGFWYDSLHPNASGHDELTMTFVPSLFDALEKGKPLPMRSTATGFAHATAAARVGFTATQTIHPFAYAVSVRAQGDGVVATIEGATLDAATATRKIERGGRGAAEIEETTLTPGRAFTSTVSARGGNWTYTSSAGQSVASTVKADGTWHQILVSHYTARGETLFFVDGRLAGKTPERLEPRHFSTGGAAIDLKDLLIYRSALNADEAAALHNGTLLQSSLEIYAPLADKTPAVGATLENRAQSLTAVTVDGRALEHVER